MSEIDQSQLVDLDQIAALVMLSRRTLEEYTRRMPAPYRRGRGGRASLWLWPDVRTWLVSTFDMPKLPEKFPRTRAG